MATKVVMEALSPTMEEGRLVEWKVQEGEAVRHGDVLAEVETDKAVMELVSRTEGVLLKQLAKAGATVPVAEVVGWIGTPGEQIEESRTSTAATAPVEGSSPTTAATSTAVKESSPATTPTAVPVEASRGQGDGSKSGERIKASPLARRIASERGLDLGGIAGSGPEGRIIKRDLADVAPAAPGAMPRPPATMPAGGYEDVPLSQIRKTIAKRLVQSLGPIPTFYLTTDVDMERAWDARNALNADAGDAGKVSFNDIVIKAVAIALRQHPACNAWWQEGGGGGAIRQWHEVHVGMAVAIPDGLITPVIRHADVKGLREIGAEARTLAQRARERRLTPEEYTGATFSVSNLGMFDIHEFTALINPPEAGIIAVGRIAQIPSVVDGAIVPRRRMRLTMSCDHRVIDGATGAAFLQTVKRCLENPLAMVW